MSNGGRIAKRKLMDRSAKRVAIKRARTFLRNRSIAGLVSASDAPAEETQETQETSDGENALP